MKKYFLSILIVHFIAVGLFFLNFISTVNAQIDPGLIAFWDFSQVDGDVIVDKIGNYNGENEGGKLTNAGYIGSGMIFDLYRDSMLGVGMKAVLPGMEKMTVLYRIKFDDLPNNANRVRILVSGQGFSSELRGSSLRYGIVGSGGDSLDINDLSRNSWHHFAFVYDKQKLKFYINGNLVKTSLTSGADLKGGTLNIGNMILEGSGTGGIVNNIQLDEIKIYNVDLTIGQILEEYNDNNLSCTSDVWDCSGWSTCSPNGSQTRACTLSQNCFVTNTPQPAVIQSCIYTPPLCTSWTYSEWSTCSATGQQARTILSSSPNGCAGGSPVLTQSCISPTIPTIQSIDVTNNVIHPESYISVKGKNFLTNFAFSDARGKVLINDKEVVNIPYYLWSCAGANCYVQFHVPEDAVSGYIQIQNDLGQKSEKFNLTITPPICTSWTYSTWSVCSVDGQKTRTVLTSSPNGCKDGSPVLSQSCTYIPPCTENSWQCGDWNSCSVDGKQTRSCTKTNACEGGVASPSTTQSCTYVAPVCSSWTYSGWGACSEAGQQTRTVVSALPNGCAGGSPSLQQSCTPACSADTWTCGEWNQCSSYGTQSRSCTKSFDCPTASTPSPATSQNCTPPPPTCNADTWTCGGWDTCTLSGIQNRSCSKTFDCPSVETAPPTTAQYCEAPNRPTQQVPQDSSDEISNQDAIIKSTVKLLCPVDVKRASQGSGTVIDPSGTILTNKHVIAGTLGCLVGFINEFNDEPYFGERQIADIVKVSSNQDLAILKIRNPQNRSLASIDIKRGNSNPRLGTRVVTYGYPAKFGKKLTYTSGDFSGTDGNYIKTTAILEHGNSGGGAYLKDGAFIGVPSAVVRGELNALGYILSVGAVNAWLGNSTLSLGSGSNNQYSRVSVLEDIDLQHLDSLKLFIPETDKTGALAKPVTPVTPVVPVTIQEAPKVAEQPKTDQKTPKAVEKVQPSKPQEESIVIEATNENKGEVEPQPNQVEPEKEQKPKRALLKRFFSWLAGLFSRWAR